MLCLMMHFGDNKSHYLKNERLINLNCFETGLLAELSHFSKRPFSQWRCMQPFPPPPPRCLSWHDEMRFSLLSIPYPLCSATRSSLSAEGRLFGGCQSRPITRWQSICCFWSGMSNGTTSVLITSPHTCTPPRATHLIAPRRLHPCYRP